MNQKRYLQELAYHLRSLPKDVRDDIIEIYRDQFKIAELEGRSEEDTVLLLGRAKANAEKELAIHADQISSYSTKETAPFADLSQSVEQANPKSQPSARQKTNIPLLILLIILNVMFVLVPALGLFLAGLGIWLTSVVLMATPLLAFWQNSLFSVPEFYPVLAAFGLGVLLFVAMHYLSKLSNRLVQAYFKVMSRLVKG